MTEAAPPAKRRILIVEDHPIVRRGLRELLEREPDLMICGEAEGNFEALKAARESSPDLAIVDLSLKEGHGLDLIKTLRREKPKIRVLVLSAHEESLYAERALRAKAGGYIMKQEAPENLVKAVRRVLRGEIYVSDPISRMLLEKLASGESLDDESPIARFTDRELEVFRLLGQGHTSRVIADSLCVSIKTVETYREHIRRKLGLKNSSELLRQAIAWAQTFKP